MLRLLFCYLKSQFLFLAILIAFPTFIHAGQLIETFDMSDQPLEIGQGWDSQREQPTPGRCIIFSPVQARGQVSSVVIEEVDDSSELSESLNISASGTANYLAGSTNISGQFIAKSNVSATNKNYSLHAQVRNGLLSVGPYSRSGPVRFNFPAQDKPEPNKLSWSERLLSPGLESDHHQITLTEEALKLLNKENGQQEFLRYCGDSYVASISSGAEVHALISHETQDSETNQKIEAHIKASYGMGEIEGDLKSEIDEILANSKLHYYFSQIGGGEGILPIQKDDLLDKLHSLQKEALRAPVFYELSAASYQGLINWPDTDLNNPELRDTTEKLVELYLDIKSLYTTYVDVWNERDQHAMVAYQHRNAMDKLSQCAKELQKGIAKRQHAYSQYRDNQSENVEPPFLTNIQACPGLFPKNLTQESNHEAQARIIADHYNKDWLVQFKLNLPLPPSQAELTGQRAAEAIVERYVAKSARRACMRNPSNDDCLPELQIIQYTQQVPLKKLTIDTSHTVKSSSQDKCWGIRSDKGEGMMVLDDCSKREWDFTLSDSGFMYINDFCLNHDKDKLVDVEANAIIVMKCEPTKQDRLKWHIDPLNRICGIDADEAISSCDDHRCLAKRDDSDILRLETCDVDDMQQRWHSVSRLQK